jgi:hypothetical protein
MIDSILTSTKKVLGLGEDYTAFDEDILTHINASLSIVEQLGLTEEVFVVEDASALWSDLDIPEKQLSLLRTYVFLRVRMLFDPPATSFLIEATNNQLKEYEYRLSYNREVDITMSEAEGRQRRGAA